MNTSHDFNEFYLNMKKHFFERLQEEKSYDNEIAYGVLTPIKLTLSSDSFHSRVECKLSINNVIYNYATLLNYQNTQILPEFNIYDIRTKLTAYLYRNKANLYLAYLDRLMPTCIIKEEVKPINSYFKEQFISLYNTVGVYEDCFICLERINKDTLYVRNCGHIHCVDCEKLLTKNECPICRS